MTNFRFTSFWRRQRTYFNKYEKIEGWLTPSEARGLADIAQMLPHRSVVVEIGSWKGKSTWCISYGMKKGVIYCIDPFNAAGEEGSYEIYQNEKGKETLISQFQNNMQGVHKNVTIEVCKGYSSDFVGRIPRINFLFIDGDHSIEGCEFDFQNYKDVVTKGGFIAFHDYYPQREELGPTWVINNLVLNDPAFCHFKTYDSLMVFRKV